MKVGDVSFVKAVGRFPLRIIEKPRATKPFREQRFQSFHFTAGRFVPEFPGWSWVGPCCSSFWRWNQLLEVEPACHSQQKRESMRLPQALTPPLVQWVRAQWFKRKGKGFWTQLSHFQANVIYIQSLLLCVVPMLVHLVYKRNSFPPLLNPETFLGSLNLFIFWWFTLDIRPSPQIHPANETQINFIHPSHLISLSDVPWELQGRDGSRSGENKPGNAEPRAATQGYFSDCSSVTSSRDNDLDGLNYGTTWGKIKPGLRV